MLSPVYNQGILYEGILFPLRNTRPNLITYSSIIPNGVFYVIRYFALSRGRKHYNTFHSVLLPKFRTDPNESVSANTQFAKPKISLYVAMHA